MKKLLRIQENQNKTFKNIARQFDIEYTLVKQSTNYRGILEFWYNITSPITNTDLKTVDTYINLEVEHKQAVLNANVLFSLYSTLHLRIVDLKYPTYNHFFNAHIDLVDGDESEVSIDHKLPKSTYPELTFEVSNWSNMPKRSNRAKGSKSELNAMLDYHEGMAELIKSFIA